MNLPLLLAWRFLKSSSQERSISTMLRICFISIVIGTGSLTLIAAIMKGFEQATHKKLQGVHADLIIHASGAHINYKKLSKVLEGDFKDTVTASSPMSVNHVMIQSTSQNLEEQHSVTETSICLLKAIDPATEHLVSALGDMIIKNDSDPQNRDPLDRDPWDLKDDKILIGAPLALHLGLHVGSSVTLIYQSDQSGDATMLERKQVTIGGLFKTGIHDFDEQILIAPFALVNKLYQERVSHVSLSLKDQSQAEQTKEALRKRLQLEVYSWKDLYPPLVSALTLEKYAMWIILMLVTLVASLTILALLYMYAQHKQTDIALLKAMGIQDSDVRNIFVWIAVLVTWSATLVGIAFAVLGTWLLQTFPFIKLPDVYYVSHLPASLDMTIVGSVILFAGIVSLCAGLFPHRSLRDMQVSHVLKGLI